MGKSAVCSPKCRLRLICCNCDRLTWRDSETTTSERALPLAARRRGMASVYGDSVRTLRRRVRETSRAPRRGLGSNDGRFPTDDWLAAAFGGWSTAAIWNLSSFYRVIVQTVEQVPDTVTVLFRAVSAATVAGMQRPWNAFAIGDSLSAVSETVITSEKNVVAAALNENLFWYSFSRMI